MLCCFVIIFFFWYRHTSENLYIYWVYFSLTRGDSNRVIHYLNWFSFLFSCWRKKKLCVFSCAKNKEWKTWFNLQQNGELDFSVSHCCYLFHSCSLLYTGYAPRLIRSVRSQWVLRAIIIFSHFPCTRVYVLCLRKPADSAGDIRVRCFNSGCV